MLTSTRCRGADALAYLGVGSTHRSSFFILAAALQHQPYELRRRARFGYNEKRKAFCNCRRWDRNVTTITGCNRTAAWLQALGVPFTVSDAFLYAMAYLQHTLSKI
jgi:hypothetical protein